MYIVQITNTRKLEGLNLTLWHWPSARWQLPQQESSAQSPPSPTNQALNQLLKGYQMAMHNAALLAKEVKELRAANEKKKRK